MMLPAYNKRLKRLLTTAFFVLLGTSLTCAQAQRSQADAVVRLRSGSVQLRYVLNSEQAMVAARIFFIDTCLSRCVLLFLVCM